LPAFGEPLADDERGAAGVAGGEGVLRLAAERDRHRLVERRGALGDAALAHQRAAELRERRALHGGIAELVGDRQRGAGVALGRGRVLGALGLLDLEGAALGARPALVEQTPRAGEPARRGGHLPVDPVLAGEVRGDPPGRERRALPAVGEVGLAPVRDPLLALAEPPQRLAVAVERLGVAGRRRELRREHVAGAGPVGLREALPSGVQVGRRQVRVRHGC